MFALKPFQENAIAHLKEKFLTLWKLGDRNVSLTLKSPTGSGKTVMMAQFLRDIVADPRFQNADVGFLWITNSDSLVMQSKEKLFSYYGGASENTLLDLNDLRDGQIPKNGVFFINWQKLVSRAQTNRKLRTEYKKLSTERTASGSGRSSSSFFQRYIFHSGKYDAILVIYHSLLLFANKYYAVHYQVSQ